ncbi:MAG: hypothetical protein M3Y75_06065 [Actinomycetota bacterium]|nr:hypothetical protein [Actinomycetota bacterium]
MLLSGRGSRAVLASAALLAALLLLGTSALHARAASTEAEADFCQLQELPDYTAPFERMPNLRQPSESGQIGFGPKSLRLSSLPTLVFGGGEVGFSLSLLFGQELGLPWSAKTSLVKVNGNGRPIGKPRRSVERVGRLQAPEGDSFRFQVPDVPAFYRGTIVFHGASGQKLGRFSSYYRVMRSTQGPRLRLNASAYPHGSVALARVENFGTIPLTYGVGYSIERLEGATWVPAPESPSGPIILIGLTSPPGMSGGRCLYFRIPDSMPAGRYRMVVDVKEDPPFRAPRERVELTLTAEFDVVP